MMRTNIHILMIPCAKIYRMLDFASLLLLYRIRRCEHDLELGCIIRKGLSCMKFHGLQNQYQFDAVFLLVFNKNHFPL